MIKLNLVSVTNYFIFAAFLVALALPITHTHMNLKFPTPRTSNHSPYNLSTEYTACHGKPASSSVEPLVLEAGQEINITFSGSTIHHGGHCEFSLSYAPDVEKQPIFVAIRTIVRECFVHADPKLDYRTYVRIPKEAPEGKAIFAWTWVNSIGNREFYMACSDVYIQSASKQPLEGPEIVVANLKGHYYLKPENQYKRIAEHTSDLPLEKDGRKLYLENRNIVEIAPNTRPQWKGVSHLQPYLEKKVNGINERLYFLPTHFIIDKNTAAASSSGASSSNSKTTIYPLSKPLSITSSSGAPSATKQNIIDSFSPSGSTTPSQFSKTNAENPIPLSPINPYATAPLSPTNPVAQVSPTKSTAEPLIMKLTEVAENMTNVLKKMVDIASGSGELSSNGN